MAEIGALLLVLGAAALSYVALRGSLSEGLAGPTGFWTWACVAIFGSGFSTLVAGDFLWSLPIGYALGTAYPALLLSGALAYAGRRAPLWILVCGVIVGFARGLLALGGAPEAAQGIALVVEPTVIVFAAAIVFQAVRWEDASTAQRWLAPGLLAMAAIEAVAAALHLGSGAIPLEVQAAFVLGIPLLLALQIAAVSRRAEVSLLRSRQELERRVDERTAELRASEERYRIVSELSSDYSFALRMSPDYRDVDFEWVTDGLERITGFAPQELERGVWRSMIRLKSDASLIDTMEQVLSGEVREVEIEIATRSGAWRDLLVLIDRFDPRPDGMIRLVGAGRDITERKRAEAEAHRLETHLQEAQRIESLGMLAGGIAHDFNNMLAVILGNARLAHEELEVGTPPGKRLDRIESAAAHATRLTQQLLTYSGKASVTLRPLDVSALVRELGDLLQVSMAEQGRVELDLAEGLPGVEADSTQLRQIVLNLVTNAAECFEGGGGCVRVRTHLVEMDATALSGTLGESEAGPGRYVALEVSDDGPGIPPDVALHMFEPFFSTKPTGHGLGLAAVLGIVRAHRGVIRLSSQPGTGASFQVLLPASALPIERDETPVVPSIAPTLRAPRGRVLLVDDDESVREVARAFLERAGFEVWSAEGGRAAVDLFSTRASEFDVVVLDLRMPDMGGEQVFLEMRRIRPDLPVVLTSGFDEKRAAQRFSARGVAAFVGKPFEPDTLVEAVRRAVARATSGTLY